MAPTPDEYLSPAHALLKRVPLVDGHNDFPYMIRGWFGNNFELFHHGIYHMPIGQTDLTRLRKGLIGGQFWSAFIPIPKTNDTLGKLECLIKTLQQIDTIHLMIENFPDHFGAVNSSRDIETIFRSGRIASLIGVEGLHQIADSTSVLRLFHKLGVRYITLCHDEDNRYADSSNGKSTNGGLSSYGLDIIREMNRIGMIADLSHTTTETQKQVLSVSEAPVIFSHSSCNSLLPSPRNVTDEILDLLKTNNGLIMICFLPDLVSANGVQEAMIDQVIDHIIYAGQRIGFEHVGIGSDFDGMLEGPKDLDDVSKYPQLVDKLFERGLSEDVIAQTLGGNVIRVLDEVEAVSRELKGHVPVLSDPIEAVWTSEQKTILTRMGTLRSPGGSDTRLAL